MDKVQQYHLKPEEIGRNQSPGEWMSKNCNMHLDGQVRKQFKKVIKFVICDFTLAPGWSSRTVASNLHLNVENAKGTMYLRGKEI